jgi:hypothetical protein
MNRLLAILLALTILSQFPAVMGLALIAMVIPAIILILANTLFVYTAPVALSRFLSPRIGTRLAYAAGASAVGIVAVLPSFLGRSQFAVFSSSLTRSDFSIVAAIKPRTFELPLYWGGAQVPGQDPNSKWPDPYQSRPYCGELCQKLLFTGSADGVFVKVIGPAYRDEKNRLVHSQIAWKFFLNQASPCPDIFSRLIENIGAIDKCLIEERVEVADADVVFEEADQYEPVTGIKASCGQDARFRLWHLSHPVKSLLVKERSATGMTDVERLTEVRGLVPPWPFYIVPPYQCNAMTLGPQVATISVNVNHIDQLATLSRRYGISLSKK